MTHTEHNSLAADTATRVAGLNEALAVMPDETGHFGPYGGRFVSEVLMTALQELDEAYRR